jgi:hypothetical protein
MALPYTDLEIEAGITALMDRGQNKASALRTVLNMMLANMSSLVIPAGAHFLFGSGVPSSAKGVDGDVYDNILTGDRYGKDAGVWTFQYRAKGDNGITPRKGVDYQDGYTPRKGVDYRDGLDGKSNYDLWLQAGNVGTVATFLEWLRNDAQSGADGQDGTIYHVENYDPAATDGNEGDIWDVAVTLTTERRYKKTGGVWRKFYDNTGVAVIVTPPNTAPNVLVAVSGTATVPRFTAQAGDSDGIQSIFVKVFSDAAATQLVTTFGPSAPADTSYITTWSGASAGTYYAFAVATDTKGLSATSTPGVPFTVAAAAVNPIITDVSPTSGQVGASVLIQGSGFGSSPVVRFNGVQVVSAVVTDTQIACAVPSGATTGRITVATSAGVATSPVDFTVTTATTTPPVSTSLPWRAVFFAGNSFDSSDWHYLAGASPTNFTTEIAINYTPPAGTSIRDNTSWMAVGGPLAGMLVGAHSGYNSAPGYYSNSLVVYKADSLSTTGTVNFSVVTSIDMTVPGRIPAGIGGSFSGLGPQPIVCSPEYVARPGGKAGLFFMYQPNGLRTSNSYILYIESLDNTLQTWGNAVLITGKAMPYDVNGVAPPFSNINTPSSWIDPFYFYYQGKHYLILRGFTSNNYSDTCMGLRIVAADAMMGPYDEIASDLFAGGPNAYITKEMEGQWIQILANGTIRLFVDRFSAGGYAYADSVSGSLAPTAFGPFVTVGKPGNYNLRHATAVDITAVAPVPPSGSGPAISIAVQKTSEAGGIATYTYTATASFASSIPLTVKHQETDGNGTRIISITFPANQTVASSTRTTAQKGYGFTYILTVQPGAGYVVGTPSRVTMNVSGTGAQNTGKPVVQFATADQGDGSFLASFSRDGIYNYPTDCVVEVQNDQGTVLVTRTIPAGESQIDYRGFIGYKATSYTNIQTLQENSAYTRGAQYMSSFFVPGTAPMQLLQIENDDNTWSLTGGWSISNPIAENPGMNIGYCPKGQDGDFSINFSGDTLEIYFPHFGPTNPTQQDIYIDGVFQETLTFASSAAEGIVLRFSRYNLSEGAHTLTIRAVAAYQKDAYLDFIRVKSR